MGHFQSDATVSGWSAHSFLALSVLSLLRRFEYTYSNALQFVSQALAHRTLLKILERKWRESVMRVPCTKLYDVYYHTVAACQFNKNNHSILFQFQRQ